MASKISQKDWVKEQLRNQGKISRNKALQYFITRLADIIFKVKKDGWRFDSMDQGYMKQDGSLGIDHVYIVTKEGK